MKNSKIISIINAILFLGVLAVNGLANALPINGLNTGELSDMYPNLFVPAGVTFSIWGLIYILLAVFTVYSLIIAFKGSQINKKYYSKFGLCFIFSSIANMTWIFLWHYKLVELFLLAMLVILISLIYVYIRIQKNENEISKNKLLLFKIPISIYLGWISVATIANVIAVLVNWGWNGFGISEVIWTIIMIVVATILGLLYLFKNHDIFHPMVVIWALIGIIIKRNMVGIDAQLPIIYVSYIMIAIITVGIIYKIIKKQIYD